MATTNTDGRTIRSVQHWPGGRQLFVSGDVHAPLTSADGLRVHGGYHDWPGVEATEAERAGVEIQDRAELLLSREVLCNDDALVSALLEASGDGDTDLARAFSLDNVENTRPDPDDWTMGQCREFLGDEGHDMPDPNPWAMDRDELESVLGYDLEDRREGEPADDLEELRAQVIQVMDDESADGLDDWRDAVRDNATDADVYQWWRVSPYLLDVLRDIGAVVLDNDYGEWWGRTCCGQGVIMDGTLQDAARFIEARHADNLRALGMK